MNRFKMFFALLAVIVVLVAPAYAEASADAADEALWNEAPGQAISP